MTDRPRVDQLTDDMLDQLYAELDALKAVTIGYCGHCGRGDCSPTADQWLEQRQRADKAERAVDHLADRYRGAEAAIARVRALHQHQPDADYCDLCSNHGDTTWPCATLRALDHTT